MLPPHPAPCARKKPKQGHKVQVFSIRLTPPEKTEWSAVQRTEYDTQVEGYFRRYREICPKYTRPSSTSV